MHEICGGGCSSLLLLGGGFQVGGVNVTLFILLS